MKKSGKQVVVFAAVALAAIAVTAVAPDAAEAFAGGTASRETGFGSGIWSIASQTINGGIGFTLGAGAIVWGALNAVQSKILPAIGAALGGAALIKVESITDSLGYIN